MITDVIHQFPTQFSFEPVIENMGALERSDAYIIAGMGGSALPADIMRPYSKNDIVIHRGYDLPRVSDALLARSIVVAVSYSGNTEETVSALEAAHARGLRVVVIASGGKLIELARAYGAPYVEIPRTGIQPRHALGFMVKALVRVMGDEAMERDITALASSLDAGRYEAKGKELAELLYKKVPIFYASDINSAVAYNWKIKCNESAKIPAFSHVLSELNHNEMTGFDSIANTKELSEKFHFVFLSDTHDHQRIAKRMGLTEKLYNDRGLSVTTVALEGNSPWERVFSSLITADWMAYHLATRYGTEPEQVPMVEEFKKMMA